MSSRSGKKGTLLSVNGGRLENITRPPTTARKRWPQQSNVIVCSVNRKVGRIKRNHRVKKHEQTNQPTSLVGVLDQSHGAPPISIGLERRMGSGTRPSRAGCGAPVSIGLEGAKRFDSARSRLILGRARDAAATLGGRIPSGYPLCHSAVDQAESDYRGRHRFAGRRHRRQYRAVQSDRRNVVEEIAGAQPGRFGAVQLVGCPSRKGSSSQYYFRW